LHWANGEGYLATLIPFFMFSLDTKNRIEGYADVALA